MSCVNKHADKETSMEKSIIKLSEEQRASLQQLVTAGTAPVRKVMHAHILLKTDRSQQGPKWSDEQMHEAFGVGMATIWRVRRRFVEEG